MVSCQGWGGGGGYFWSALVGRGQERLSASYQYCALRPTLSLWYVRPWIVLYSRMLEVMESVELAVSPNAESLSSSRSCCVWSQRHIALSVPPKEARD